MELDPVTATLAYKLLSIGAGVIVVYWGYRLFALGLFRHDDSELQVNWKDSKLLMKRAAPGTFFALFGSLVLGVTILRGYEVQGSQVLAQEESNPEAGARLLAFQNPTAASGGINLASLSRGTGAQSEEVVGIAVTRVESTSGEFRTDEQIQVVFDRYKAALYRLYSRALRENPNLRGQIVLRLKIEPDGSVSSGDVESSEMDAPHFEELIVESVRTFNFGAMESIPAITILYPIQFFPAA